MMTALEFLVFLLLGSTAVPDAGLVPSTRVSICLESDSAVMPSGAVLVLRRAEGGESSSVRHVLDPADPAITVDDGRWIVSTDLPGFWAPELLLDTGDLVDGALTIRLWKAGLVRGRFAAKADEEIPSSFRMQLTSSVSRPEIPDHSYSACRVDEGSLWECAVPEGRWDLTVRPKGFIPHYQWDVNVSAREAADLGTLALARGASLSGWLAEPLDGATVALKRHLMTGPDARSAERLTTPLSVVRPDERGFFMFQGVEPGMWVVEASAPNHAATAAGPFEVREETETSIRRAIEILRPGSVDIAVSPGAGPDDLPWSVEVWPAQGSGIAAKRPTLSTRADSLGFVRLENERPGRYTVFVSDASDNRFARHDIEVASGVRTIETIAIEYVRVTGTITLAGEPLPGTIWFGGRHGVVRVSATADDEGNYEAVLPRAGSWPVAFESGDSTISIEILATLDRDRHDETRLDIDLPDNSLSGVVVDHEGRPTRGAKVSLGIDRMSRSVTTDDAGRFRLRCLPPGQARLQARKHVGGIDLSSRSITLDVTDELRLDDVQLQLGLTREVQGRVTSGTRPVVGATVLLIPDEGTATTIRTDVDGTFTAEVHEAATAVDVIVRPGGYSFTVGRSGRLGEHLAIEVSRDGGRLEIAVPGAPDSMDVPAFIVRKDHVRISPSLLLDWARGHGEPFYAGGVVAVPNLQGGRYEVCRWNEDRSEVCAGGRLATGGTLRLTLPDAE